MFGVSFIQRPGEAEMNRKTLMLDEGRGPIQCGYYYTDTKRVHFIRHFDEETAAAICAEVAKMENVDADPAPLIPAPTPPEWIEPEDPSPIIVP